jgi:uncharacterized protein YdhG (YjbR/CyaY superfamily)
LKSYSDIDAYIADFPETIQDILQQVRDAIRYAAPQAKEKISYGMPTFIINKNLVHFAACKNHLGFYPAASGIEAFKKELSIYKGAKGSVQFPLNQPMPIELITMIVRFRVNEDSVCFGRKNIHQPK